VHSIFEAALVKRSNLWRFWRGFPQTVRTPSYGRHLTFMVAEKA